MHTEVTGIHHVSTLSDRIGTSDAFYRDVLGLRRLIWTVNQDDPSMPHVFYGDDAGSAGSEMTVFGLPGAHAARRGTHQFGLTTFRVGDAASLVWWRQRLTDRGVDVSEVHERDGRPTIVFDDPVATRLAIIVDAGAVAAHPFADGHVPAEHQLVGLGYPVGLVREIGPTADFLSGVLGFRLERSGVDPLEPATAFHVFAVGDGPAAEFHVAANPALPRGRHGSGGVHHVAFRVPDVAALVAIGERLDAAGYPHSPVIDRHYFTSLYVREPGHLMIEIATDGPGFDVDGGVGPAHLTLPPGLERERAAIEAGLRRSGQLPTPVPG